MLLRGDATLLLHYLQKLLLLDNAGPIVFCTDPDVVCECLDSYGPLAASLFAMYKSQLSELFDLVGLLVTLDIKTSPGDTTISLLDGTCCCRAGLRDPVISFS